MDQEHHESQLSTGAERFFARAIEHGLTHGRRSFEDFLRHFPPHAIMEALADQPQLRANILVIATGLRPRIAVKKTPGDSAADLVIALEEQEADAETIVTLFDPDDRVRYLEARDLWSFLIEGEFWNASPGDAGYETARDHIRYLLECGLAEGVVSARDVVEGAGVSELARHLPPDQLAKILATALDRGRDAAAFDDDHLIAEVPCEVLAQHLPLPVLWNGVIESRVAEALGVAPAPEPEVTLPSPEAEAAESAPAPEPAAPTRSDTAPKAETPPPAPPAPLARMKLVKKPAHAVAPPIPKPMVAPPRSATGS